MPRPPGQFRGKGAPLDMQGFGIRSRLQEAPGQGRPVETTRSIQIPPPWQFPTPAAQEFFRQATGSLPAGAGSVLDLAALELRAPDAYKGVVRVVAIFVDAPLATLDITWTVLVNDAPYPGWDNLSTFPRAANNLSIEFEGVIRLPRNAKSAIRITNNNAVGPWTVGASYSGWWWPQGEEVTIYGREV